VSQAATASQRYYSRKPYTASEYARGRMQWEKAYVPLVSRVLGVGFFEPAELANIAVAAQTLVEADHVAVVHVPRI